MAASAQDLLQSIYKNDPGISADYGLPGAPSNPSWGGMGPMGTPMGAPAFDQWLQTPQGQYAQKYAQIQSSNPNFNPDGSLFAPGSFSEFGNAIKEALPGTLAVAGAGLADIGLTGGFSSLVNSATTPVVEGGIGGAGGSGLTQAEMDALTAQANTDIATGMGTGGAITGTGTAGAAASAALTGINPVTGALEALPGATTALPGITSKVGLPVPSGTNVGGTPNVGSNANTGSGNSGSGFNLGSLGGLSALLPGLAMGASIAAKPKLDTSNISSIADTLRAKAATEKPDTSALTTLAGQLSGPGTLEDLLSSQAKTLIPAVSTGDLPPGAQTEVANAVNDAKNSIRSHYASMNLSGSTMEGQELAAADARGEAMKFQFGQQLTQTGISEAGAASADINAAANIQSTIINEGLAASGLSTTDLADAATLYKSIMDTQLKQDASLQDALARFASASAIGTGLAASGKTDTTGTTGLMSSISSIGSGISSGWDSFLKSIGIGNTPDPGAEAAAAATDTGVTGSLASDLAAGITAL